MVHRVDRRGPLAWPRACQGQPGVVHKDVSHSRHSVPGGQGACLATLEVEWKAWLGPMLGELRRGAGAQVGPKLSGPTLAMLTSSWHHPAFPTKLAKIIVVYCFDAPSAYAIFSLAHHPGNAAWHRPARLR